MRKRSLTQLGETEMEVLHHVWALGRATVAAVHARIAAERSVAYTTVMTVMKKLADKGYLRYDAEGPAYVYEAARRPESVRHGLLRRVMDKVFHGSPSALVQTLVQHEKLSATERDEIRRLLDAMDDDAPVSGAPETDRPEDDHA